MLILSGWIVMSPLAILKASDAPADEADIAVRARVRVGGVRAGVGVGPRGRAVGYARTPALSRAGVYAAGYRRGYVGTAGSAYYYPTTPYYYPYYPYY